MAAMANITIKKADGTTDLILTALAGSAGDGIPAKWRDETTARPVGWRTVASEISKPNTRDNARSHDLRFSYPVVRTVNGADVLVGKIPFQMTGTCGDQFTQAEIDEAVSQAINFFSSTLVRTSVKSGYAPRS